MKINLFWYKDAGETTTISYDQEKERLYRNDSDGEEELDSVDTKEVFHEIDSSDDYGLSNGVTLKQVYEAIQSVSDAEDDRDDDYDDDDDTDSSDNDCAGYWTTTGF